MDGGLSLAVAKGAASGATSSVVKALADWFFAPKKKGSAGNILAGRWHGHWTIDSPPNYEPPTIDDVIHLEVDKTGVVSGHGENPYYGAFEIRGNEGQHSATLAYRETDGQDNTDGVCLILKGTDKDELEGFWWQQAPKHKVMGGRLKLKRLK